MRRELIRHALVAAVGAAIGLGVYREGGNPLPLFVLPILSLWLPSRLTAFFLWFAYYLAGSRVIPASSAVFFSEANSLALGIGLWVVAALILSGVWAVFWTGTNTSPTRRVASVLGPLVMLSVPPFGIIGWLSPLLSISDLLPGTGLAGMAAVVAVWAAISLRPSWRWSAGILATMAVAAMAVNLVYVEPKAPTGWMAVNTALGKYPDTEVEHLRRHTDLVRIVEERLTPQTRVLILPEQAGGDFDSAAMAIWRVNTKHLVKDRGTVILMGASVMGDEGRENSLVAVWAKGMGQYATARQTVPVSMWTPWRKGGFASPWWGSSVHKLRGTKAAFLFCFEEYLVWPIVADFLINPPDVIVGVTNGWWVKDSGEDHIQKIHAKAWARLFGVPLLRAINV